MINAQLSQYGYIWHLSGKNNSEIQQLWLSQPTITGGIYIRGSNHNGWMSGNSPIWNQLKYL